MTSGATLTAEIDLARSWKSAYIDMTGAKSEVRFQASDASGGTYRQVYHPAINSSTVGVNIYKVTSASSGGYVPIPAGLRYLKVETTATVDDGNTFKIICSD